MKDRGWLGISGSIRRIEISSRLIDLRSVELMRRFISYPTAPTTRSRLTSKPVTSSRNLTAVTLISSAFGSGAE